MRVRVVISESHFRVVSFPISISESCAQAAEAARAASALRGQVCAPAYDKCNSECAASCECVRLSLFHVACVRDTCVRVHSGLLYRRFCGGQRCLLRPVLFTKFIPYFCNLRHYVLSPHDTHAHARVMPCGRAALWCADARGRRGRRCGTAHHFPIWRHWRYAFAYSQVDAAMAETRAASRAAVDTAVRTPPPPPALPSCMI